MAKIITLFLALMLLLASGAPAQQTFSYPQAKKVDQVDDYHGTKVSDPYRWLEDTDSADSRTWIDAENAVTNSYLETIAPQRQMIKDRLTKLWNYEKIYAPNKVGNFYIYAKNDGLQNQNVLYITDSVTDPGRVFFDPNKLTADGTAALNGSSFTDDGKLWAYGVAIAGSDRTEWHVRDVATGQDLSDTLKPNRQGGISWVKDNSGFFYSRFPDAEGNALKSTSFFQKLYFHKLGTPQADDYVVYERPDDGGMFVGASVSEDGNWLIISVGKGTAPQNMVYFKNLKAEKAPIIPLVTDLTANYSFIGNDGANFYFETDKDASRGKVVVVNALAKDRIWKDIVPEAPETLQGVDFLNNQFVLNYLRDAHTQIRITDIAGKPVREVQLPGIGSAGGFGGKRYDTQTFYTYSSYNAPPTIYRYDMKTGKSEMFRQAKVDFDPNNYEVEQVFYGSKDGTKVPMFIVHKKGIKLDGSNPTILYGYGGFNIPQTPGFSVSRVVWMEMGGIFAIANLRGGSEYGETWHQGGMKLKKQNVFDDFISAAEWLIDHKYTSTPKLAIQGGSNGGLLIGAVLNQRPDLFGAALPAVGVMDMLRFGKFTIGKAWESDYGSPDDPKKPEEFKAIYAYSPLHNIKAGTKYPPTMVTTADHDDRVFPAHSFKYTATMQAAQGGAAPILIRIEVRAGHGAGKPTAKVIQEQADIYGFLMKSLGMN
jgi:prolyl oligopeptidase